MSATHVRTGRFVRRFGEPSDLVTMTYGFIWQAKPTPTSSFSPVSATTTSDPKRGKDQMQIKTQCLEQFL